MRYQLDNTFLEKLPKLCRMTAKDFRLMVQIGAGSWERRVKQPELYKVFEIIRICNTLRIPSRLVFVQNNNISTILNVDKIFVPVEKFKTIRFDMTAFRRAWKSKSRSGLGKDGKEAKMGIAKPTVNRWLREDNDSPMYINSLFAFCDLFGYDIFEFIIDENLIEQTFDSNINNTSFSTEKHINDLAIKNENLRRQVTAMQARLDKAYNEIRELHKTVRHLKNLCGCDTGEDDRLMIEANDNTKEEPDISVT